MVQDPFKYFRVEAHELVDQLGKGVLELERGGPGVLPKLLRLAHTLKGAARVVRRPDIAEYAHAIEDALAPYRDSNDAMPRPAVDTVLGLIDRIAEGLATLGAGEAPAEGEAATPAPAKAREQAKDEDGFRTVWMDVGELDALLEGVTETHAQLGAIRRATEAMGRVRALAEQLVDHVALKRERTRNDKTLGLAEDLRTLVRGLDRGLASAQERMERELQQVHDTAEQLRLAPANALFAFLERAVRDVGHATGKLVKFESRGGDVRLDSHVLRIMHEALLQIVRNAVAHGIESETDRRIAGKPQSGVVSVEVVRRGQRVVFRCKDDGRGIDVEAVRRIAMRRNAQAANMTGTEIIQMLLNGGISTSASLTELAGRGVGMDVVRSAIGRLRGSITAESVPGKGTTFELTVPLTLAATEVLLMQAGAVTVAVPFDAVRHVVHTSAQEIYRTARGHEVVHDGRAMPFVPLARLLDGNAPPSVGGSAVVIAGAGRQVAIGVERLRGTANVVFRSLPEFTPAAAIVAGASLDADGNPQIMLDADNLVTEAERHSMGVAPAAERARPVLIVDDSLTTRMLEQSILESAGYEVDLATSAEEALEVAHRRQYALFLVDVEMPGMDGFSFIERIRSDPELRDIPAILVTSRNEPEDFRRGKDVGAQDYVVKSEFNQANLLGRIRELVARR
ncbi:MAG TPA: response regulator [Bauldia sp.]|nr:response regulator [Bauldia sp.]